MDDSLIFQYVIIAVIVVIAGYSLFKVVAIKNGVTYESNEIQIDSYNWVIYSLFFIIIV